MKKMKKGVWYYSVDALLEIFISSYKIGLLVVVSFSLPLSVSLSSASRHLRSILFMYLFEKIFLY